MNIVDDILLEAMVKLVRKVPWGPDRDVLSEQSKKLRQEASLERGWDNYSTAADLDWQAGLYTLAAEARFPRQGDRAVSNLKTSLLKRLGVLVAGIEEDMDVGEVTRVFARGMDAALRPVLAGIDNERVMELKGALVEMGVIEEDVVPLRARGAGMVI